MCNRLFTRIRQLTQHELRKHTKKQSHEELQSHLEEEYRIGSIKEESQELAQEDLQPDLEEEYIEESIKEESQEQELIVFL